LVRVIALPNQSKRPIVYEGRLINLLVAEEFTQSFRDIWILAAGKLRFSPHHGHTASHSRRSLTKLTSNAFAAQDNEMTGSTIQVGGFDISHRARSRESRDIGNRR
jgi:hypothetical protein